MAAAREAARICGDVLFENAPVVADEQFEVLAMV